jgi:hypothetical protein
LAEQRPQRSKRGNRADGVVGNLQPKSLLEHGLQLHPAEAVEVQILREAELAGVGGDGGMLAGDRGDELEQRVLRSGAGLRGAGGQGSAGPLRDGAAQQLAGGGVGEL